MKIKKNALIGMLEDTFNGMAFTYVKVARTDRFDHDKKEYMPAIHISFETKQVNPNNDEYGKYLKASHGFDPLTKHDQRDLNNGNGLDLESAKEVIERARELICSFDKRKDYLERIQ